MRITKIISISLLIMLLALVGHVEAVSTTDIRVGGYYGIPHAPEKLEYSVWHTAPLEVAKVFGRAPGCSDADSELINETAKAAIQANLDPAIGAALVAVESSCNSLAISNRGAIGLTQVMPRIWSKQFDFSRMNLLNRHDSLTVGFTIMEDSIAHYGTVAGIQRYNGVGVGCDSCDGGYATRILSLAHK